MTETITWIDANEQLPDDEITVLVYSSQIADEPVWLGYHEEHLWLAVDGTELEDVTHWAHVPAGPQDNAGSHRQEEGA